MKTEPDPSRGSQLSKTFKHRANSGGHRRIRVEAHLAVSLPPDEADRPAPTQFAAGGFVTDAAVESRTKDMEFGFAHRALEPQ